MDICLISSKLGKNYINMGEKKTVSGTFVGKSLVSLIEIDCLSNRLLSTLDARFFTTTHFKQPATNNMKDLHVYI